MPTNWLDVHAGAVQGISSVVLVIATIILVWVTWTYAETAKRQARQAEAQVEETQRQRFDQHRPVVYPVGRLPLIEGARLDWSKPDYEVQLQNVGAGVALVVCGVMFPPEPTPKPSTISPRYTVWREPALLPSSEARSIKLDMGRTIMDGDAQIDRYQLFAPKSPTQQDMMLGGQYNIPARLTLTYEDIFMRKHAAVFDYIDLYGWQPFALLSDVSTDLEDLDAEARRAIREATLPSWNA